ncbi:mannose-P-dolichol utilization defect 1 protein homolog [Halichondria panicea]|uniref:mannose-P-dolichol utilization defect 1 protein homolog n=1 Tax=Halichondria panicea TaxID=6063 RepID=UPI00312B7D99
MTELLKTGLKYFYPGDCYETVWENYDFFDSDCFKMFVSRALSMLILLGSIIVKVPQIMKIVAAGSAEGLSYLSIFSELGAVTFTCTYNLGKGFPFSAWGESFFIALQNVIIISLMFNYKNQRILIAVFAPVYSILAWYLTSDLASMELLSTLQTAVIPLMMLSRFTQMYAIYSNGSTGQLSLITSYLNWSGAAARIFTTMQETQDPITLLIFSISFTLNTIIMIQFVVYWNAGTVKKGKGKEKKEQ